MGSHHSHRRLSVDVSKSQIMSVRNQKTRNDPDSSPPSGGASSPPNSNTHAGGVTIKMTRPIKPLDPVNNGSPERAKSPFTSNVSGPLATIPARRQSTKKQFGF